MKANEAPEKIFLEWYRVGDEKYRDWCIIPKTNDESVEYIRTDAFIEKAVEWLKNNVENYYYLDEAYDKVISIKNFNSDFKKYMKEE